MITYNHEKYIRKCLQSLVDQVTPFDFEILVRDDCSTDNTPIIISEFHERYPNKIKPMLNNEKAGGTRNYLLVHQMAVGKYIAHLDGDDFALPGKLATQVRYLDLHPECVAVVHRLIVVDCSGHPTGKCWPKVFSTSSYDLETVVLTHPEFGHSSLMYRKGSYGDWLSSNKDQQKELVDFYFYIHLASQGSIGSISENLGAYRLGVGVSTSNNFHQLVLDALNYAKAKGVSEKTCNKACARQYLIFASKALLENDLETFIHLISSSRRLHLVSIRQLVLYYARNFPLLRNIIVFLHHRLPRLKNN